MAGCHVAGGPGVSGKVADPEDFDVRGSVIAWTIAALAAEVLLAWGLEREGLAAALGINLGWFGLFIVGIGVWRKAPVAARVWPVVLATATLGLWAVFRSVVGGDDEAPALVGVVALVLMFFVAIAGAITFATRRGWMVDSPLRRRLDFAVIFGMTMMQVMGAPAGVWKGRLSLAGFVALLAISFWPAAKPAQESEAPSR